MGVKNSLESAYAIWQLLVFIVQIPIFIIGCFFQPIYLYFHLQDERERISRRLSFARRLGLTLDPDIRRGMKRKYRFLRKVGGRGQYALNIMWGKYKGHEVTLFDYHTRSIAGDAWGFGDIDFESHEFSEKFNVRDYQNRYESFPGNLVAKTFNFTLRDFFNVDPAVRVAPSIEGAF